MRVDHYLECGVTGHTDPALDMLPAVSSAPSASRSVFEIVRDCVALLGLVALLVFVVL